MSNNILLAREFFGIDKFPGNLFEKITTTENYIERYKIFLFKEDLNKLSGFISYVDGFAYIGINYKRSIGHQNLTLAHEIGHKFLRHEHAHFDTDKEITEAELIGQLEEKAATRFGMELLYPEKIFLNDFYVAVKSNLFDVVNRHQLATYLDNLCHTYFLSFSAVVNRFFYKFYVSTHKSFDKKDYSEERRSFIKSIHRSSGGNFSNLDKNFYIANGSSFSVPFYPVKELEEKINRSIESGDLGYHTGNAILLKYKGLGENNNG